MDSKELQEKVLTMLEGGYTKIAIADRLGISDERLDYVIRVVTNHKIAIKQHIRQAILSMDVDELNHVEISNINMSSVITRLINIYGKYEDIPNNTPALEHVLKFTGAAASGKQGRPRKNVDMDRAQALLDIGIKKAQICKALKVGKTFVKDKVDAGLLDDSEWQLIDRHKTLKEVGIE